MGFDLGTIMFTMEKDRDSLEQLGCGQVMVDLLATVEAYPKPDDKIRSTSLKAVVDWAKSCGIKQFLLISSAGIYKATEEPPYVEGLCSMFIPRKTSERKIQPTYLCFPHDRMLLKLMLVMFGVEKYISDIFSSWVRSTWSGIFVASSKFMRCLGMRIQFAMFYSTYSKIISAVEMMFQKKCLGLQQRFEVEQWKLLGTIKKFYASNGSTSYRELFCICVSWQYKKFQPSERRIYAQHALIRHTSQFPLEVWRNEYSLSVRTFAGNISSKASNGHCFILVSILSCRLLSSHSFVRMWRSLLYIAALALALALTSIIISMCVEFSCVIFHGLKQNLQVEQPSTATNLNQGSLYYPQLVQNWKIRTTFAVILFDHALAAIGINE
ncbi:hypothetical protein RHMOL_Rhmol04G0152200 [Rhododendron molle]|uniref:Uncharacterized protein n=3 Tax=Rhododendron molle TaxID=49168 RepID=A0ACC0P0U6_RHOML|nr:hypothetical protein RHMOL_Rhmol04G0152200 [Rhododendron molle]KAI8559165.1 hypothetical protein RHMOL_Rhmol04G0152200 [Rhododendron molle]KAI8559166.1 hypothetical protein RHMOL_Rhmol04G0152200 [Rhododendron molle]